MKKTILIFHILFLPIIIFAQSDTTFWFAAPDISAAYNYDHPIVFRITSYQQACNISISQPANGGLPIQTFVIPANSTQTIDLSVWLSSIECTPGNVIQNKGIKIKSDNKISVYYEVNVNGPNPEIFALKGRNALGNQFYISSQNILANNVGYSPTPTSSFNIAATEDNCVITVTPTSNIVGHLANLPFTITLNKGQTYAAIASSAAANQHLGGSFVSSTKPIAITLSDDLLDGSAYYSGTCHDLAGDQTVPVNVTGTEYIGFRSNLNPPYDKLYITATQNGTAVTQDGVFVSTLNAGQTAMLPISGLVTYVQTSAPAYAYQLAGYGCEVGSAILPKLSCTGSSTVSVTRSTNEFFYLTLLVKNGGQGNFLVNNASGIINASQFNVVPGTGGVWYYAKIGLALSAYPNGSVIKVSNSNSVFQMGVLQGGSLSGESFGYFSDFNSLEASAQTSTPNICSGTNILLFAQNIASATYLWTGPNSFTSNQQNPVISNTTPVNSGKYYLSVTVPGCGTYVDSIGVNVKPKSSAIVTQTICEGQTFEGYGSSGTYIDHFTGLNGCDSMRTLNLTVKPRSFTTVNKTICEGQTYFGHASSGTYVDTYMAANGCDSIRTLILLVKPRSFSTFNPTICQGQSYAGYSLTGSYSDTFTGANGCDSIRTINLTVIPKTFSSISRSICQGQSFAGYTTSGIYVDTLLSYRGCDSIRTINLVVNPTITSTISQTICEGQIYGGHSSSGNYTDIFVGSNGCDSIRILNLVVKPISSSFFSQVICQGQSFMGYNTTGIFKDTLVATNGCDSIRTLNLTVKSNASSTITQAICSGQSYAGYNVAGTYLDTLISFTGCDSVRKIILTVDKKPNLYLGLDRTLCAGDSIILSPGVIGNYTWQDGSRGRTFLVKQPGLYSVTINNACGNFYDKININSTTCQVYFPNVFTPNKDGKNDVFNILNAFGLDQYFLRIYNRWGQKIFESNDINKGWDGTFKGQPMDAGVYVYYCRFLKLNLSQKMKGTVTLLR